MKRSPLKRGKGLARKRFKRKPPPKREWTEARSKVDREGRCRGCGRPERELRKMGRKLEAAHLIGREYDIELKDDVLLVHEDSIVPLCGPQVDPGTCHNLHDARQLNLWEKLRGSEAAWCMDRIGAVRAMSRIKGRVKSGEAP